MNTRSHAVAAELTSDVVQTTRKTTSANDDPSDLLRRTEKQWRHEERELAQAQSLGKIILTVQGASIPLSSFVLGDSPCICEKWLFIAIVVVSLLSMLCVAVSSYFLLEFDRYSARHYSITGSGTKYPNDFDEVQSEEKRKALKDRYYRFRPVIGLLHLICFLVSVVLFCMIVVRH